jgi:hypothetical protein
VTLTTTTTALLPLSCNHLAALQLCKESASAKIVITTRRMVGWAMTRMMEVS